MQNETLARQLVAEFIGTAMLLMAVVGSGIMAERLAGGNVAVALLANTIATGAALLAIILVFAPVSGAHINPLISMVAAVNGDMRWRDALRYIAIQIPGALTGAALANAMFELPVLMASTKIRTGTGQWLGEFVAAFGLVGLVIATSRRHRVFAVAAAVAAYITAAYWFTSSTSFANPAVTIARSISDTFAGIRPVDVPAFIAPQILGGIAATYLFHWLVPKRNE